MGRDGMECKTKRAEGGRGAGIGRNWILSRPWCAQRTPFSAGGLFCSSEIFLPLAPLSGAVSEPLPLRCPALCLLSRHK